MQAFMISMLICSVTMSALALVYMAATPLLSRRYSQKGRYHAWLIIVIGLIIPFRPQFNSSIVTVTSTDTTTPVIQIGNKTTLLAPAETAELSAASSSIAWWQIAIAVWMIGMVIFLACHAVKHYRFMKMTRRWSDSISDEQILIIMSDLKAELEISRDIGLYQCESIGSPLMIGFINSRILLPKRDLAQDKLRFILKHELIHYKRKDLWYKALVLIATAIHWFNPIVYLMATAIDVLCEMSCDIEVVRNSDVDARQHYSQAIIGVARYQSKMKTTLSTSFYRGNKGMKKRIFSIMDTGKKRAGLAVICAVLLITLGTGAAVAATAPIVPGAVDGTDNVNSVDIPIALDNRTIPSLDGKTYVDLTNEGSIQVKGSKLSAYQLFTNSTNITISIPANDNCSGTFYLYVVDSDNNILNSLEFVLDANNPSKTFTGCTSSRNYYIEAIGVDGSIITISD